MSDMERAGRNWTRKWALPVEAFYLVLWQIGRDKE